MKKIFHCILVILVFVIFFILFFALFIMTIAMPLYFYAEPILYGRRGYVGETHVSHYTDYLLHIYTLPSAALSILSTFLCKLIYKRLVNK